MYCSEFVIFKTAINFYEPRFYEKIPYIDDYNECPEVILKESMVSVS